MQKLLLQPTDTSQWHAVVNKAQQQLALSLPESIESYLVFMLLRFTQSTDCLSTTVAQEYLSSTQLEHCQRELALQTVGDKCLLFSGFFPGQATRRHVRLSYYVNIGRSAYASLATMDGDSAPLFADLSARFTSVMDVMQTIRSHDVRQTLITPRDAAELSTRYHSKVSKQLLTDISEEQLWRLLHD